MTLSTYEPQTGVALYADDPTGGRLVAWAQAAQAANQLAKALVTTAFVPKAFAGNVGDATAVILMGDEVGLSPLASLRSIFVIHGTPAMYARTMVALAQSRGHEIWTEVDTPAKVVVCGRRQGSDKIERSEWTIARAQQAGYTNNAKYKTQPQEMLYAKAAATVARKVAADVLAGVPYSVEDVELEEPAATVTVTRAPAKAKRATPVPAETPEPDLEPAAIEAPAEEPDTAAVSMITEAQMRKLHTVFSKLDITDRDEKLAETATIVGRDVSSSTLLTKDEATRLIETLEWRLPQAPEPDLS